MTLRRLLACFALLSGLVSFGASAEAVAATRVCAAVVASDAAPQEAHTAIAARAVLLALASARDTAVAGTGGSPAGPPVAAVRLRIDRAHE